MSKMITIPAASLKWCPCEFEFKRSANSIWDTFYLIDKDGDVSYFNGIGFMPPEEEIQVIAKDYEEACVARLKEMYNNKHQKVVKVEKRTTGGWGGYCWVNIETAGTTTVLDSGEEWWVTSSEKRFSVNCDPRPHESEYEIEVSNG
jgi:hypothetical protein